MSDCVFCDIVHGDAPAEIVARSGTMIDDWAKWVAFTPLNPHAPGHVLFVPETHISDASDDSTLAAEVFRAASDYVFIHDLQANIITSVGPLATQSVFHLHIHVIPRDGDDNLMGRWPWIGSNP